MPNIKLHYLYRDGSNYKNFSSIVFANPNNLPVEFIELLVKSKLIDSTWFYASQWHLPDLHFNIWDDDIDHTFHEFEMMEYTEEPPNTLLTLAEFIQLVEKTNWPY